MQGPSTVSCILQLNMNIHNTAIHSMHKLNQDREIHERYLSEVDTCLAFSKTNLLSKCIEVNSKDNLEQILTKYPEMLIMNTNDLFFNASLLN
jgi:CRISPR/Cas system-associated endonuclease Cas3-HD